MLLALDCVGTSCEELRLACSSSGMMEDPCAQALLARLEFLASPSVAAVASCGHAAHASAVMRQAASFFHLHVRSSKVHVWVCVLDGTDRCA